MYFVYIISSTRRDWIYIGLTNDVNRRFEEHNNGWVKKTKFYRPFELIHVEVANNRIEARDLEKFFKSGYGREVVSEIELTIKYSPVAQR
ncbi:MAG: Excinuclease ABC C subunit domain protein [Candidatus Gottesmanbacteria bacterium GW2011_GWC2_39_8]|uniref:Excinuclease ABC C subunit domain protein n=1 Tax=Candidatus Gottesmanbacteria bacterium GW2011_GWC2_39_8 TaxID=1618450 RepID=A0A0G0Q819_9BACT|nr:MAG: Excinuclease ABC C subunit domain protein [Candidatus Gottesmanbacteria bacterium GW2011_GWC2_39_8]